MVVSSSIFRWSWGPVQQREPVCDRVPFEDRMYSCQAWSRALLRTLPALLVTLLEVALHAAGLGPLAKEPGDSPGVYAGERTSQNLLQVPGPGCRSRAGKGATGMRKTALALLIAIATLILGFSPTPVGAGIRAGPDWV